MDSNSIANFEQHKRVYAVINNIPVNYHSADLRRFFSVVVETGGFDCFHFRHRPELQSSGKLIVNNNSNTLTQHPKKRVTLTGHSTDTKTFCCIVRVTENAFGEFLRTYHQRNWLDNKGNSMSGKCLISRLKISTVSLSSNENVHSTQHSTTKYLTRRDKKQILPDHEEFFEEDLLKLAELHPPTIMPQGNVGTPTMFFMKLIQECRLPPSVIKKLQLDFPKSRSKGKYGSVPFNYERGIWDSHVVVDNDKAIDAVQTELGEKSEIDAVTGNVCSELQTSTQDQSLSCNILYDNQIPGNYACALQTTEHLQRHQSASNEGTLCDATGIGGDACLPVTNNNEKNLCRCFRANSESETTHECKTANAKKSAHHYKALRQHKKEERRERLRLMAEKIEEKMINFERAGSESGDDNDTCEEWERHEAMYDDVSNQSRTKDRLFEEEMEVVWEKGGSGLVFYTDAQYWQEQEGDFDEQTADDLDVDMSAYYEAGAGDPDIRDFLAIRQEQRRRRGVEETDRFSVGIGKFERHTKGFGRKIMEKQGWQEGLGLGSSVKGIVDALDCEGQHPGNKRGLGYQGEKLVRYCLPSAKKHKVRSERRLISTIYDNPSETDSVETLHRRNEPEYIKHRGRIN